MPLDQLRIEMIGVGPQARRGRRPACRRRAVPRLPDMHATPSTGAAETAANTFARERANLAGAVAIGGHDRGRPAPVPCRLVPENRRGQRLGMSWRTTL